VYRRESITFIERLIPADPDNRSATNWHSSGALEVVETPPPERKWLEGKRQIFYQLTVRIPLYCWLMDDEVARVQVGHMHIHRGCGVVISRTGHAVMKIVPQLKHGL